MTFKSFILKQMTPELRQTLIRRSFDLDNKNPNYIFKIAKTREELEGAFRLLYKCYLRSGLMNPNSSEMRCNIYQALPFSTTLIAKDGPRVIGTVCVIRDSQIGLPSDKSYLNENNLLRKSGECLCEASALAVDEEYRTKHGVSFPLMKLAFLYSHKHMNCTTMCAVVHPKAYDFYAGIFNFRKNGEIIKYDFANGALATHLSLDLNAFRNYIEVIFRGAPSKWNVFQFIFEEKSPEIKFPRRKSSYALDPVMKPGYLKYFFVDKTDVFKNLSLEDRSLVRSAWELHFSMDDIPYLNSAAATRFFRLPVDESVVLLKEGRAVFGTLYDLSIGGVFLVTPGKIDLNCQYEMIFNFGTKTFRAMVQPTWFQREGSHHRPRGYGVKFLATPPGLLEEIRNNCGIEGPALPDNVRPLKKAA